jgi:hypothetical protein
MVNNSTNINKNHLSPQLIEWLSTIPPISKTITYHINSLSDGKQFHQYQQKSPITSTHWVMSTIPPISTKINSHLSSLSDINNSTNINKNQPLILTHWVMVNNSPNIKKITSHLNSLSDVNNSTNINKNHLSHQLIEWYQQFHQYQQISPLTSTHWVMVNNSTNINKNHLSP